MDEIDHLFLSRFVDVNIIESFTSESPSKVKLKIPFSKYINVMKNKFLGYKMYTNHVTNIPGYNVLRLFDVLPNFLFNTSETKCDY